MAITLKNISLVIPKKHLLRKKFNNSSYSSHTGEKLVMDKFLVRDSADSIESAVEMVLYWSDKGLKPYKIIKGEKMWDEMCIVDSQDGPTLPCDWIEWNEKKGLARLKRLKSAKVLKKA